MNVFSKGGMSYAGHFVTNAIDHPQGTGAPAQRLERNLGWSFHLRGHLSGFRIAGLGGLLDSSGSIHRGKRNGHLDRRPHDYCHVFRRVRNRTTGWLFDAA